MRAPWKSHKKSIRQKTDRRKRGLMKKASEYSRMCDADVFVGIRLRESGRLYTLLAETSEFWSSFVSQLDSYYPIPIHRTDKDFDIIHEDGEDAPLDCPTKEADTEKE
ncbi:hypothetical protein ETB97_007836 [Aspergillus alliaceus]|uniref:MADS-box domain-containing protein n=1 Tax=Petromyces alliaceus TaxID=209559 RepID=A0A8H5ZUW3_PETAA|nr:hypothetical protein ETB97_007836 [Aspergillus burnettii]